MDVRPDIPGDLADLKTPRVPVVTSQPNDGIKVRRYGYTYDDLDKNGIVFIWKPVMHCQKIHESHYAQKLGADENGKRSSRPFFTEGHRLVVTSFLYEFTPEFYKKYHYNNLLQFTDRMVKTEASSFQHLTECCSKLTGELLHRSVTEVELVEAKTNKLSPLPRSFLPDRGSLPQISAATYSFIESLATPSHSPVTSRVVEWSDLDANGEVNDACYLCFVSDAIAECCSKGKLVRMKNDFGQYQVTRVTAHLPKDRRTVGARDVLVVHVWQETDHPTTIHIAVRKGGVTVCQCTFECHEVTAWSLL